MAHGAMVDTYLHRLLDERFDEDLDVRDDGYHPPLPCRPRLRVVPGQGNALRVEVAAPVALGLQECSELFVALNAINLGLPYGRVYLVEGVAIVEHTIPGEDLTGDDVDNALSFVTWVVDQHGVELVDTFGGSTSGTMQMALPVTGRPDDDSGDGGDADGEVEPGVLVGASAGGYL
jgi:hypothetical protein